MNIFMDTVYWRPGEIIFLFPQTKSPNTPEKSIIASQDQSLYFYSDVSGFLKRNTLKHECMTYLFYISFPILSRRYQASQLKKLIMDAR